MIDKHRLSKRLTAVCCMRPSCVMFVSPGYQTAKTDCLILATRSRCASCYHRSGDCTHSAAERAQECQGAARLKRTWGVDLDMSLQDIVLPLFLLLLFFPSFSKSFVTCWFCCSLKNSFKTTNMVQCHKLWKLRFEPTAADGGEAG